MKRFQTAPFRQAFPKLDKRALSPRADNGRIVAQPNGQQHSTLLTGLPSLPSLANKCYIVGQGRRMDVVWSRAEFMSICEHMLNGNQLEHFLTAWVDARTGLARFAKAPFRKRADKHASWAWDTVTAKAKIGTSIGFYLSNKNHMTCWGALDFDAHNGEHERARKWSLAAFELLLKHPHLYLVLCTSGGSGFHLFIFTRELYPISDWIVLLKQVCALIGAEIAPGVCEILPNERAESQPVGKGIRAPGTFNPKSGQCSLIEIETIEPLLELLPRTWGAGVGKVTGAFPRNNTALSLQKSTNTYFPTTWSASTEAVVENILARFEVKQNGTRNKVLMQLIGDLIHKFGREAAERIAEELYRRNQANIRSSLDEHRSEFATAWEGMRKKVVGSFSSIEQHAFNALASEHQREAFSIIRAFAGAAEHEGKRDFAVSQASLADRLSVSPPGAGDVVRKLCKLNVIAPTQRYIRHTQSARFRWLLARPEQFNAAA